MNTSHIDQLAQWYADAEQITKTNLPRKGDTLIYPRRTSGYIIEADGGGWIPELVHSTGETVRILARAPEPKPAWHDALAVIAHTDYCERQVWERESDGTYSGSAGDVAGDRDLRDVTPLVEAKVTDEAMQRVFNALDPAVNKRLSMTKEDEEYVRYIVTAVLGLETE